MNNNNNNNVSYKSGSSNSGSSSGSSSSGSSSSGSSSSGSSSSGSSSSSSSSDSEEEEEEERRDPFNDLLREHGTNIDLEGKNKKDDGGKLVPVLNPALSLETRINWNPDFSLPDPSDSSRSNNRRSSRLRIAEDKNKNDNNNDKNNNNNNGGNSTTTTTTTTTTTAEETQGRSMNGPNSRVWIQCYKCEKWRVAHPSMKSEQLPHAWCCSDNTWAPEYASCRIPQEPHLANEEDVNDDANNVASTLAGMSNENKEEERQWNIPPSVNNRKIIPKRKKGKAKYTAGKRKSVFLTRKYKSSRARLAHYTRDPLEIIPMAWGDSIKSFEEARVYYEDADNFQVQFVGISDDKEYVIPKSYVVWRKHGNLCPVCDLKSGDLYAFKIHLNTHIQDFDNLHSSIQFGKGSESGGGGDGSSSSSSSSNSSTSFTSQIPEDYKRPPGGVIGKKRDRRGRPRKSVT